MHVLPQPENILFHETLPARCLTQKELLENWRNMPPAIRMRKLKAIVLKKTWGKQEIQFYLLLYCIDIQTWPCCTGIWTKCLLKGKK